MQKKLFAAKDERDIKGITADTAVFLWNCFQRELHGVWVSTKQGNLDKHAFDGKFRCQVCIEPSPDSLASGCLPAVAASHSKYASVRNGLLRLHEPRVHPSRHTACN